jgi:dihydrofolate reductase
MSLIRAYLATSLDGFVAGPHDELAWLEGRGIGTPPYGAAPWINTPGQGALEFDEFLSGIGCILMGRRTYDIVAAFPGWPYGEVPMRVVTHRPLESARSWVEPVSGEFDELVARARDVAGERDVYVDGAAIVREILAARLLDHLVVTVVPTALGRGVSLFGGLPSPAELTVERVARYADGLVQIHLRSPVTPPSPPEQ